jgi:hypothetical protein
MAYYGLPLGCGRRFEDMAAGRVEPEADALPAGRSGGGEGTGDAAAYISELTTVRACC